MPVISVPDPHWITALEGIEDAELVAWDLKDSAPRDDIEVVVPPYMGNAARLARLAELPRLQAVQLVTAGYEHAVPYLPSGVALANGAGIHDTSTAELALALMLASQRRIPDFVRAQESGKWLRAAGAPSLADRRVLVVGYGSVGRAIVSRLQAFEAQVTAVASRARGGDELVDRVHGVDELPSLLPDAEIVVLIVPLTDSTRHLADAEFLAALPDDALVVNVARGGVVDTDALLAECRTGRLRAALDVTDPEPLPSEHPLWRTEGVLISPHVGGASTAFEPRALRFLRRELAAYAEGLGLRHIVHRA
ncbi:2-hydroxyacid dehydrogenase [Luteipulveratus sp. YIM 133132]|uniref:2-hydroxyacid dehydrogenase n=1 Tax=Luteipulveratus flavus TaxID=3031728 RepID=UPI0023B16AE5|nr:2-hydroxyacid dehydrogenase [Luteipulveratus sp. YIM 133132]MDE9366343.1 2-hydroxyacid dehydrogenase [Luteipulveratus sp. YIM 133132]